MMIFRVRQAQATAAQRYHHHRNHHRQVVLMNIVTWALILFVGISDLQETKYFLTKYVAASIRESVY